MIMIAIIEQYIPPSYLLSPSSYNADLIEAARVCLDALHQPGRWYKKVGYSLTDCVLDDQVQLAIEQSSCVVTLAKRDRLMALFDRVNRQWGCNTLSVAAAGVTAGGSKKRWEMRQRRK